MCAQQETRHITRCQNACHESRCTIIGISLLHAVYPKAEVVEVNHPTEPPGVARHLCAGQTLIAVYQSACGVE